jgi:hypothetical protein
MKLAAFFAALAAVASCNSHPSTNKDDAPHWVGQTRHALTLRAIDNESTYMKQLVEHVPPDAVIHASIDRWRTPDEHEATEPYLYGPSAEAIAAYLATQPAPPAGREIAFEKVGTDHWRTHLVDAKVELDQTAIVKADTVDLDGRPGLTVDLTPSGGRRLADVTSHNVGHKLALEIDGKVAFSPVIMTAITGARFQLTLGAGASEADAQVLADQLSL